MGCEKCGGNCGSCGGCGVPLELTGEEIGFLEKLGQFSFLPVARKQADMTPVYLEDEVYTPELYSQILLCLEKKGLVSLEYEKPLAGADMGAYQGFPVHGSISLTQRGYGVLELLEIQGVQDVNG